MTVSYTHLSHHFLHRIFGEVEPHSPFRVDDVLRLEVFLGLQHGARVHCQLCGELPHGYHCLLYTSGIIIYTYRRRPELRWHHEDMCFDRTCLKEIASFATLTCVQQSVMNQGILMVLGLVNSFGTAVMAAFAAAVKIDSFAYMPVQEFGNAFSTLSLIHI